MIGAIVKDGFVENMIVIDEADVEEMQIALGCEIVDARPYGLSVGDLRTERGWTRNADGEQIVLELLEPKQYDGYTLAVEQLNSAESAAADEALMILSGEVE